MSGNGAEAPLCFMHVPKCAGMSVHAALAASLPDGAIAPRRSDAFVLGGFSEIDRLPAPTRSLLAIDDAEVASCGAHSVVSGHFSLPTLLRLAPAANVATVLREPRARLLSSFLYGRFSPLAEQWGPYWTEVLEPAGRFLDRGLANPLVAHANDNLFCRLVLRGDPRIEDGEFIAPDDASDLGGAALEQLDRLGYVGLLEWDDIWSDLSTFFSVPLTSVRTNVSGEGGIPAGALPIPPFEMRAVLDLIEQRSAADRYVYETLLARRCGDAEEARRIAEAAFAEELVRFGDLTGSSATKLSSRSTEGPPDASGLGADHAESPESALTRPAGLGSLGSDSYIAEPYKIRSPHCVHIGDNVVVGERSFLSIVQSDNGVEHEPELRIGDDTRISSDLFVHCAGRVEIGEGVRIGARVFIGDSGRDYDDPFKRPSEMRIADPAPVRIGDGAVLGAGAIILEGVTIGEHASVRPGSVVTRNVKPGSTVLGNPARVVRTEEEGDSSGQDSSPAADSPSTGSAVPSADDPAGVAEDD